MSHLMCQVSHVRCHVSGVFFLTNWWSLLLEGLLSTEPTLSSFFRKRKISRVRSHGPRMLKFFSGSEMIFFIVLKLLGFVSVGFPTFIFPFYNLI